MTSRSNPLNTSRRHCRDHIPEESGNILTQQYHNSKSKSGKSGT